MNEEVKKVFGTSYNDDFIPLADELELLGCKATDVLPELEWPDTYTYATLYHNGVDWMAAVWFEEDKPKLIISKTLESLKIKIELII